MGNGKTSGKSVRLSLILVLIGIIPMMVSVTTMAVMLTENMKKEIKDGVYNELMVAAKQVDAYFIYDVIANGYVDYDEYSDHEYIESLKDSDIELTLFEKDTCFLTSLKDDSGNYMEGTKASSEVYEKVSKGEAYTSESIQLNGIDYFVYYQPIFDDQGNFWGMAFAGEPKANVQKIIRGAIIKIIIVAESMAIAFVIIIILVGRTISKRVCMVAEKINTLADGRLDASFAIESSIREVSQLAASGEMLQRQLSSSVGGVKSTTDDLGNMIINVDRLLGNSADGANTISQTVSEMAQAAQNMAVTVEDTSMMMADMGGSIDEITKSINNMNQNSEHSMSANRAATDYMRKLETASEKTAASVKDISQKIAECNESAEKIKAATDAITEISNQTNLLSLNASIEAARAGDSGRGFAVVASEIQKLAEQSNDSATDIQKIIDEILAKVAECVDKAEDMNHVIIEQVRLLEETKIKIADMSSAGIALTEGTELIDKEAVKLAQLKDNVINAISDLAAISEENAASAYDVSKSASEVSASVESTKTESQSMRALAGELEEKMSFFKI